MLQITLKSSDVDLLSKTPNNKWIEDGASSFNIVVLLVMELKMYQICQIWLSPETNPSKIEFPTPKARKVFTYLQKAFTKVLILYQYEPEHHIYIETNASGFAINGALNKLTLDQS